MNLITSSGGNLRLILSRANFFLMLLIFLTLLTNCVNDHSSDVELTKDEIIQNAWDAMFAGRADEDIISLYLESFVSGNDVPSKITIKRPNLFRNENVNGVLVFDGSIAAWEKQSPDANGNPRGPEMIPQSDWKHFEVDIALLFPAFFDYESDFRGIINSDGIETYAITVMLPLGSSIIYYLDTENFL